MGRLVEAVGAVWRQLRPWRQLEGLRAAVRMGASAVGHEVAGLLRSRGRGHDELSGHIESVVLLFCCSVAWGGSFCFLELLSGWVL
jgi:hypothetical protein